MFFQITNKKTKEILQYVEATSWKDARNYWSKQYNDLFVVKTLKVISGPTGELANFVQTPLIKKRYL
jgi:hypothetical protein